MRKFASAVTKLVKLRLELDALLGQTPFEIPSDCDPLEVVLDLLEVPDCQRPTCYHLFEARFGTGEFGAIGKFCELLERAENETEGMDASEV